MNNNVFEFKATPKISKFILNCEDYIYNIIIGSIRSGKDYSATIAFVLNILNSDYDLHMIAAVDIKNCLRIIGRYVLDFLGPLARQCKYQEAPAICINCNNKKKYIIFVGGKNNGSDSAVRGLTLASVYFTEINLLNLDFVDQAIKRTLTFKDKRRIYATFNPKGIRDPFMLRFVNLWQKEQEQFPDRKILNYETFTLVTNPIFTDEDIEQIKAGYDPESVSYKRDILGEFADPTEGLYRIRSYNVLPANQIDPRHYGEYFTVCDFGESLSATTFHLGALYWNNIDKQRELHILREYYHLNKNLPDTQKKSTVEYAQDYAQFVLECTEYMQKLPARILYDGSNEDQRNIDKALKQNKIQINPKYVIKLKEGERIKTAQSWLYQGKIRFSSNCTHCIQNFTDATHDQKHYENTGEIITLEVFDDTGHLDALDNAHYLIAECIKKV